MSGLTRIAKAKKSVLGAPILGNSPFEAIFFGLARAPKGDTSHTGERLISDACLVGVGTLFWCWSQGTNESPPFFSGGVLLQIAES